LCLSEGSAKELVIPKGTNALSETSEGKGDSACTSIVEKGDQEFVNVYYINENNLYGCPHVQLDMSKVDSSFRHRGRNISNAGKDF
jgi:hypothetical protein